jgi:hypothetical protein
MEVDITYRREHPEVDVGFGCEEINELKTGFVGLGPGTTVRHRRLDRHGFVELVDRLEEITMQLYDRASFRDSVAAVKRIKPFKERRYIRTDTQELLEDVWRVLTERG